MTNDPLFSEPTPGRFHVDDPWTSKAAARKIARKKGRQAYAVLRTIVRADEMHHADPTTFPITGATGYEIADKIGQLQHGCSTRRGELEAAGYVYRLPKALRRRTDTHALAYPYAATETGIAHHHAQRLAHPGLEAYADHLEAASEGALGRPSGPPRPSPRNLSSMYYRYLEELVDNPDGLTDAEVANRICKCRTDVGGARRALIRDGYAITTTETRDTEAGHAAQVHRVTWAGRIHLAASVGDPPTE